VIKDGEYAFGQAVADDEVAIVRAEISAEIGGALTEERFSLVASASAPKMPA
jgi:hypothetical protein